MELAALVVREEMAELGPVELVEVILEVVEAMVLDAEAEAELEADILVLMVNLYF